MGHFRSVFYGMTLLCIPFFAYAQEQDSARQETISGVVTPSVGNPISSQRFADWHYRCANEAAEEGKTKAACEIVQVARVKRGDEEVSLLSVAIAKASSSDSKASSDSVLTALVPLNVLLPAAFGLEVDGNAVFNAAYRNCNQAGCWVSQTLDRKMLSALRKGKTATAQLKLLNGQNVNIRFSLMGLTAALAALDATTEVK